MDVATKRQKVIGLLAADLELTSPEPSDIEGIKNEVDSLSQENLDRTLCGRLGLEYPPDEAELERALSGVSVPEWAR